MTGDANSRMLERLNPEIFWENAIARLIRMADHEGKPPLRDVFETIRSGRALGLSNKTIFDQLYRLQEALGTPTAPWISGRTGSGGVNHQPQGGRRDDPEGVYRAVQGDHGGEGINGD